MRYAQRVMVMQLNELPHLESGRLALRPFVPEDAPMLAKLAGQREIADTTISIPHPYSEEQARGWIAARRDPAGLGKEIAFAITERPGNELIGAVGLRDINVQHSHAELGCWVRVDRWGEGYATEATRLVLRFAFEHLKLNRVHAHRMVRNPASGRVLEKAGLRREGVLRECVSKWGVFEDVVLMAILRREWEEDGRG